MKIETAITQLKKEQEFLGLGLLELLQDIQKYGRMVYSEKTMQAYQVFMGEGAKMFAPIA
jgi:hypothetical protein